MWHKQLAAYLAEVEAAVKQHADGYVERYEEEILASDRVNLRLRIRFASGYLLEVSEKMESKTTPQNQYYTIISLGVKTPTA